jgi:endonuclease/exonuclease/phosphatase family metal-dependent hydrolase
VIEQIVRQPDHRRRIDYVFIGSTRAHPHAHAQVRRADLVFEQPIDGVWASDHFGVMVDLEISRDA